MNESAMIALFTDFGAAGPYVGQMKAAIYRELPQATLIDLMADAPVHNPRAAAYLLAALVEAFPVGTTFLAVVDPGVGDVARLPAVMSCDGRWFVGPHNGLFNMVALFGRAVRWWDIDWRPPRLSASFHGRDLFAPVAVRVARGEAPPGSEQPVAERVDSSWPQDLAEVVYIDHFGNAMTGLRAAEVDIVCSLQHNGVQISHARTFSAVAPGQAFWYENANGLVEIAVNQGRADRALGMTIGDEIHMV